MLLFYIFGLKYLNNGPPEKDEPHRNINAKCPRADLYESPHVIPQEDNQRKLKLCPETPKSQPSDHSTHATQFARFRK